ncbi:helix-turn-helix domain-containing protein [Flavobacteriaceae bacterium]|nr:helix-turn-helix domain-containing protein [Flavobacteriaceae bacterium]MDB4612565.1 helix-turn-helix domain-containing protein [Flavobacteriaceae bacterium]MDC3217928.1 helix-turn-helix domain-containing protein [Flavobacteriaceae bacterium]
MQQIAITQLTPQDLKQLIREVVQQELSSLTDSLSNTEVDRLNSREKTAKDILDVDLSTLHRWTQQGKVKAHAIGNRIYYKDSSIEEALIEIVPKKKRI